jgi:hypothetical protein
VLASSATIAVRSGRTPAVGVLFASTGRVLLI